MLTGVDRRTTLQHPIGALREAPLQRRLLVGSLGHDVPAPGYSDGPKRALIALTSSETREASVDMLRAGAKSFLVKGCSKEELVSTIHGALRL